MTTRTRGLLAAIGLALLLGSPVLAQAVPLQLAHQGTLTDASGPVTDTVDMTFRLFDDATSGSEVWSETRTIDVVGGNYSVILGSGAQSSPIESVLVAEPSLWLEITVGTGSPLLPRQQLASTPYAIAAHTAENVSGGTVDASSISVNGPARLLGLMEARRPGARLRMRAVGPSRWTAAVPRFGSSWTRSRSRSPRMSFAYSMTAPFAPPGRPLLARPMGCSPASMDRTHGAL